MLARLQKRRREETGPALRRRVSSAIALELVRRKLQASSLTAGEGYCRMDLERNNYGQ
mgnify:CR=1 FL=1